MEVELNIWQVNDLSIINLLLRVLFTSLVLNIYPMLSEDDSLLHFDTHARSK